MRNREQKIIPFGSWAPDLPAFENPGALIKKNVIPYFTSVKPFPGAGTAISSALDARCQGAFAFVGDDGFTYVYAGDATKIYRLVDSTFTDASKSGGYTVSADEAWEWAQFGTTAIGACINAPLQSVTIGGTTFADLATSSLNPRARHIGVVRRFVVIGNTQESGTDYPRRVRWCAIGDALDWDADPQTLADAQDLNGAYGHVQRVVGGGDFGLVFQERAIQRMDFVGSPEVFAFNVVEQNVGTIAPGSVIRVGATTFFLDASGFRATNGGPSIPISEGRVSKWFFDNWDQTFIASNRFTAAIDWANSCVLWSFVSTEATTTNPDKILIFHWPSKEWAYAEVTHELIFSGLTLGVTLEGLDAISASVDDLPFSLDSRAYSGGKPKLALFDTAHKMALFDGSNLAAQVDTGRVQLFPGKRTLLTSVRPIVDGGTPKVSVSMTERLNDADSFGNVVTQDGEGNCDFLDAGRYARLRLTMAAADSWTHAQGLQPSARPHGVY